MSNILSDHSLQTNAVIYARISSVAQAQKGHGLASQEARCREFARMKGYEVAEVFYDKAVSGGIIDRPGIQSALSYLKRCKNKGRHVLVIDDISRIARDIRAHLDLREAIKEAGATLESPSIEFGEDSDSILVENLLASVSQHQRQKGAEQTKNRMRARLLNGYWPFKPPLGYQTQTVRGRGKMLVRDEPLASIIEEALEGYASGRFQLQAEVARWLEAQPAFPKNRYGEVTIEAANRLLTRFLYSGMVKRTDWGVSVREGQHEGLVSYETFLKVQERLAEKAPAPARADISNDFILRGAVACADCGHPLTACWSKSKTGKKHPYYMCFKKGCEGYRKSIRRDEMEDAFAALLTSLQPTRGLITFARGMFRNIWDQLRAQGKVQKQALARDIAATQKKIDALLDRIVNAESDGLVLAYEQRITALDQERLLKSEKLKNAGVSKRPFDEMFELAMQFIANPRALWDTGKLEVRQTVLKLAFQEPPRYCRKSGFRTPAVAYPFRVLRDFCDMGSLMAEREGFEPSVRLPAQRFSRPPRSTTPAPLHGSEPFSGLIQGAQH